MLNSIFELSRISRTHRLVCLAVLLALAFAGQVPAQTQPPQWQTSMEHAKADLSTGNKARWIGASLLTGGAGVVGYGVSSPRKETAFLCIGFACRTSVSSRTNWATIVPGIAMAVSGAHISIWGNSKRKDALRRIRELERTDTSGWRVSIEGTAAEISYRW